MKTILLLIFALIACVNAQMKYFGACDSNGVATGSTFDDAGTLELLIFNIDGSQTYTCPGTGNQTLKELALMIRVGSGSGSGTVSIYNAARTTLIARITSNLTITNTVSDEWIAATQTQITPNPCILIGDTDYTIALDAQASGTIYTSHAYAGGGQYALDQNILSGGWPASLPSGSGGYLWPARVGVEPAGGCTNPTGPAPSAFTDTTGNTRKVVFETTAGTRDSVVAAVSYVTDSMARISTTDTIVCHWLKKLSTPYRKYYKYGCTGTKSDSDSVAVTIIGPSVSYTAMICTLGVSGIKNVASAAMSDSMRNKTTFCSGVSITVSGANIGRISWSGTGAVQGATNYTIYTKRKGITADSGDISITIVDTTGSGCPLPPSITATAKLTSKKVGDTGKWGHVKVNSFDSITITAGSLDSVAMINKLTKDSVAYRLKTKTAGNTIFTISMFRLGCVTATCKDTNKYHVHVIIYLAYQL